MDTDVGTKSCEDGKKYWSDLSIAKEGKELPTTTRCWRETWAKFCLRASIRNHPCGHLISYF